MLGLSFPAVLVFVCASGAFKRRESPKMGQKLPWLAYRNVRIEIGAKWATHEKH